jgi:hypothetical protein
MEFIEFVELVEFMEFRGWRLKIGLPIVYYQRRREELAG